MSSLAVQILDGFDYQTLESFAERQLADEAIMEYNEAADSHARALQEKQTEWLHAKGLQGVGRLTLRWSGRPQAGAAQL